MTSLNQSQPSPDSSGVVTLFLCGDVMTGRGVDQILPFSAPPGLFEPFVKDARRYVELAERKSGPVPSPADVPYIWGDALVELRQRRPDARIVNLETSITADGKPWPWKGIHYRMHPGNAPLLAAAGIDVCALANNHILDWGYEGLEETLQALRHSGIRTAGAGLTGIEAREPAVVPARGPGRVVVFSFGTQSSGIPREWSAAGDRPGVNLLPELSSEAVAGIGKEVRTIKRPGDVAVASIHWGGNWGYGIPAVHRQFAHLLLDNAGIDLVHGHSSHHVLGIEVHRGKLILYGCGDLVTDYEGIGGYEEFRGDLGLMYFARVDTADGRLAGLEMVPVQQQRFRLCRSSRHDALWLRDTLGREGERLGTGVELRGDNTLVLRWNEG